MVAIDVLDHLPPRGDGRCGGGDIDKLDVFTFKRSLPGFHGCMSSLARSAPGGPDVDEHHLALITVEDGLQDVFRGHVVQLLNGDALLTSQLPGDALLFGLILTVDVLAILVLHPIERGFDQEFVGFGTHNEYQSTKVCVVGILLPCKPVIGGPAPPEGKGTWRGRFVQILICVVAFLLRKRQQVLVLLQVFINLLLRHDHLSVLAHIIVA